MHCGVDIPELETPRLRLRALARSDLQPLIGFCADAPTMEFMGGPLAPTETGRRHASHIGHWFLYGYGMWAVEEKQSGCFVGRVGLIDFEGWPHTELGWLVGRPYWGLGYAPEAARRAALWAFGTLDTDHLISLIHPDNQKSIRVADKLGSLPGEIIPWAGDRARIHRLHRAPFLASAGG